MCLARIMFADDVAKCLLEAYNQLPKRGKPQGKEWTVLAGLVIAWSDSECCAEEQTSSCGGSGKGASSRRRLEVVSLATGNRCVGKSRMSTTGNVVNDCHAEVLARRCFKAVLYNDLKRALGQSGDKLEASSSVALRVLEQCEASQCTNAKESTSLMPPRLRFQLKKNASIHLCITETPCGDASIYDTPGEKCRYSKNWTGQNLPLALHLSRITTQPPHPFFLHHSLRLNQLVNASSC